MVCSLDCEGKMNLLDKINTIDNPKVTSFSEGYSKDIQTFYNEFINPRLPNQEIVSKWNILLQEYADLPDAIYPVRAFYKSDDNFIETEKGDELRRGFLTKFVNADFSLFFTDKYFVDYIEKMLLDNYCPSLNEFYELMISRKFPARFSISNELEKKKAAYKIDAKNPGLNKAGYTIAHIVDTGKYYSYPESSSLKKLVDLFDFGRGKYSDWEETSDSYGKLYLRLMNAKNPVKTKEILKSHFLRLTNPMNYFLTPKNQKDERTYNEFRNLKNETKYNIAEYRNLKNYVHEQYEIQFGKQYTDFLKLIHLPENYFSKSDGNEIIRIYYGNPLKKENFINQSSTITFKNKISSTIKIVDEYLIKSVKIVSGESLNSQWHNPMQVIETDNGTFIDNLPAKQFGFFGVANPGYDWTSLIGQKVKNVRIIWTSGYYWINIQ